LEEQSLNINDYGMVPNTENLPGIPASITAQHKERYEIVCQHGMTHARLKTKEYYVESQDFPTTGDALAGEEIMAVNGIREDDSKGRHTTTHRQLIRLNSGVLIIDTPGMRELGMWDVSEGLGDAFADAAEYLGKCRFSDCRHENEPGCAIKAAIAVGELDVNRWESYQKLKEEAVDKAEMLRRKNEWHKSLSKFTRNRNKEVW
jgi:hypothetical protein